MRINWATRIFAEHIKCVLRFFNFETHILVNYERRNTAISFKNNCVVYYLIPDHGNLIFIFFTLKRCCNQVKLALDFFVRPNMRIVSKSIFYLVDLDLLWLN